MIPASASRSVNQAEGVANLDRVPETGARVTIGFTEPLGSSGGYARYVAIAPTSWGEGVSVTEAPGVPLAARRCR